jgi:MerR family transcriptional regulator, thiopeptide resistance regulator
VIGNDGRRWSIGELARSTGMTVRALRHYDEIGLLRAGERTASGHRRYTGADVRRLYRIRVLRGLGLPLEEIARVLGDTGIPQLRALLAMQLRDLEAHAEHVRHLRERLHGLLAQLDADRDPDPGEFMATLEMMSMFETYFTQEQRDRLAARRADLGDEAVDAARREFRDLMVEGLRLVSDGVAPDDPRARDFARRFDAIGERLNPDPDTQRAARAMWTDNSTEIAARMPWPAESLTALVSLVERAR